MDKAVNDTGTAENGGMSKPDSWKRYSLGEGIRIFGAEMVADGGESLLTKAQKQKLVNLRAGVAFAGVWKTANEYSTTVAPWFKENMGNLSDRQKAAVEEFNIVNDIAYCQGADFGADPYGLDGAALKEIAECFIAAGRGEFRKPSWAPEYIDSIDRMKAIVFAHLEDINYHSESRLLKLSPEDFLQLANMWDTDFETAMVWEKSRLDLLCA